MLRHVTHMDEAGVDVIRRVGVSRQNNSGVIVCDKYKKKIKSCVHAMLHLRSPK